MKKFLFFCLVLLFSFVVNPLFAATTPATPTPAGGVRYVTCDACGYCPLVANGANPECKSDEVSGKVPGDWKKCVTCLYPGLYPTGTVPDPEKCETLMIAPGAKMPPTPYLGRQYTMIGCITSSGGFENNQGTGASSFVQALFDLLVFRITGGLAMLYLMYGGFIVLTSQSDPERLSYGKRIISGAVVGLIFAVSSVFLVNIIGSGILRIPGFSSTAPTPTP